MFKKRRYAMFAASLLMILMSLFPGAAKASKEVLWSFNEITPATALAPAGAGAFAGDTIRLTGSGEFVSGTKQLVTMSCTDVVASGTFTITQPDGTVVAMGIWFATSCASFVSFGGPTLGIQGGVISLVVTLMPTSGSSLAGLAFSLTCMVNAPSPSIVDATTVGPFTTSTGGFNLFHRE